MLPLKRILVEADTRFIRIIFAVIAFIWVFALYSYLLLYHYDTISEKVQTLKDKGASQFKSSEGYENTKYSDWKFSSDENDKSYHDVHQYSPLNVSILQHEAITNYQAQFNVKDARNIYPIYSSNYDNIFKNHPNPASILGNLDFNQRCELYFQNLYMDNHNWFVDPNELLPLDNKHEFDWYTFKHVYFEKNLKKYMEENELESENEVVDKDLLAYISKEYETFWNQTLKVEQKAVDILSHLRIFNKCFISRETVPSTTDKFISTQKSYMKTFSKKAPAFKLTKEEKKVLFNPYQDCSNLERRMYPWLSFNYPIYEKWTGEVLLSPPKYFAKPIYPKPPHISTCFLEKFKNDLNGKGLVLTVDDGFIDDTINLIKLLRALNNKLPIQIVYYDNLSSDSKKKIVKTAREQFKDLPASFSKVRHLFPDDYAKGLPKQDIWFVNVYNVINENYNYKFSGYGNKLLASIFNSFEEFILLDADTVLVKNPEWLFEKPQYKSTGAFFYRDRVFKHFRPDSDTYFFKKTLPSVLDAVMFDFPMATSKTFDMDGMNGMFHTVEAGLLVYNKVKHFNSILLLPQLNSMFLVSDRVHGDKELFWLSMSMDGDEDFELNKYHAASIGKINVHRHKFDGSSYLSEQLCSSHPSHVDGDDNSLVWFNSGYHYCSKFKNIDFDEEREVFHKSFGETFDSNEQLEKLYSDPLRIRSAIIPNFVAKNRTLTPNTVGEPEAGWELFDKVCTGYIWCAYSSQGYGENYMSNTVIHFDEEQQNLLDYYGDVWVGLE
ncbi:mannosyltransferase putative-domain-containing protein [Scheffersomyces amazonensis]|uniref:mannosyltransferase putative-domain-containing protein n=1 Tax=Scheffersomyces amazonensis TaxID=1078765 RepID=UPI00315D87D8